MKTEIFCFAKNIMSFLMIIIYNPFSLKKIIQVVFIILSFVLIIKTFSNLIVSYFCTKQNNQPDITNRYHIELLRPLVFIKLFTNCLMATFFPQYLLRLTLSSHMPATFSSIVYVTYQIFFIVMLIPGGYFGEVKSIKKILLVTTMIESILLAGFAYASNIWMILVLQVVFGCVIPISSSAEYAYILGCTHEKNRSFGFALYSNSLQASMIAGFAIGGVLSEFVGARHVFLISSGIMLLAFMYVIFLIPTINLKYISLTQRRRGSMSFRFVLKALPKTFKNLEFIKTIFCVGFPLGLLNDGIILFSLPLLLSHYHFSPATIGQLLVVATLGFFLSNKFISKKADQQTSKRKIMILGLLGIGLGLLLLATIKLPFIMKYQTWHLDLVIFVIGLILLGVFRGFLVAPSTAYISENPVTEKIGKNVALSVYRLFQTLGSIVGPIMVMFLLTQLHYSLLSYVILSGFFVLFAVFISIGQ